MQGGLEARVYPIVDNLVAAEAFLEAGVGILQFRHKQFWNREVFGVAETISRLCTEAKAQFIINDRADYARILKAGLHLGQEDLLPADARSIIGPDAMIGFLHESFQRLPSQQIWHLFSRLPGYRKISELYRNLEVVLFFKRRSDGLPACARGSRRGLPATPEPARAQ